MPLVILALLISGLLSCADSGSSPAPWPSSASVDTTAPTVAVIAPANGTSMSGTVILTATASDNVGVVGVQFKRNGNNYGTEDISSPYSVAWDSTTVANGAHMFTAVARDAAGNSTTSSVVSITVNNPSAGTTITAASCSSTDLQDAVNQAQDGYTVMIPAGSCVWTSGVSINGKGVHLQGGGSGRVIGRSLSSVTIGTGAKTFTTQNGLAISAGQTLHIERTGGIVSGAMPTGGRGYMIGTVTSYSGTTLIMDITSAGGSGSHPLWIISTSAATTITHSAGGAVLLSLAEDSSHSVEVSGIRFVNGTGTNDFVNMNRTANGKPILIHDMYFETSHGTQDAIQSDTNQGVIWNCSFVALPHSRSQLAIHHVVLGDTDSWTRPSTMGNADSTGTSNLYIEDSDFHGWLNATDFDSNARSTIRHSLFNNAGFGTHGADTSSYGQRHFEFYDNELFFDGFSNGQTLPVARGFYLRGGTGVIADNVINMPGGSDYPNKLGVDMTVMNLQRNGGPNPCWGANVAGIQYPAPRQIGMGRVTGVAGNDSVTYTGDSEPLYIWNNSGNFTIGTSDFVGSACTNPDSTPSYVVAGRDYIENTPKPGYVKYPYPHPLR